MDVDAFIHAIMSRAPIWLTTHPHHRTKWRVKSLWEEIKQQFPDYEVEDLKKRWKNLKDSYRKELKKYPVLLSGTVNLHSNWKYFDALSFIRDETACTQELYDDDVPEESTTQSTSDNDTPETTQPVTINTQPTPKLNSPCRSKETQPAVASGSGVCPKKRNTAANELRQEYLEIERKKLKILERELAINELDTVDKKSDNYHFLMSILPDMDTLPPVQKLRLRNKINQAVLEELNDLHGNETDIQQFSHVTRQSDHVPATNVETTDVQIDGIVKSEYPERFAFTQ